MARYELRSFEYLKQQLAALSDDFSLPWNAYPCIEWPRGRRERGYGQIHTEGRCLAAHRLAYEIAIGPIPDGLYICHRCDVPACFRPSHLFAGTQSENIIDCARKGRHNKLCGEQNPVARLTEDQVKEIRRRYAAGDGSYRTIARSFGVDKRTVVRVVSYKTWKHVGADYLSSAECRGAV